MTENECHSEGETPADEPRLCCQSDPAIAWAVVALCFLPLIGLLVFAAGILGAR